MNRQLMMCAWLACAAASPVRAQRISPRKRDFWITAGLTMAVTIPLDERIREFAARHQAESIHHIARSMSELGSDRVLLPVLLAGALIPRAFGDGAFSDGAIDVGLGFVVATGTGYLLRTAIGRHRPDSTGQSRRFSSFRRAHEWHSFPSGHVLAIMSVATGLAIKADRPWVTTISYGLASTVALQRLYQQKHWASDAVAGTLIGIAASATTVRWRERRRAGIN